MHWALLPAGVSCPPGTPLGTVCEDAVSRKCGVQPLIHQLRVTNVSTFKIMPLLSLQGPQAESNGFSWVDGGAGLPNSTKSGVVYNTHTGVLIGGGNSLPLNKSSEPGGFAVAVAVPQSPQTTRVWAFLGKFTPSANPNQTIEFRARLLDGDGKQSASFVRNIHHLVNPTGVQTNSWSWPFELAIPPATGKGDRRLEIELVGATNTSSIQIQAIAVDDGAAAAPADGGGAGAVCLPWRPPAGGVTLQAMVLASPSAGAVDA